LEQPEQPLRTVNPFNKSSRSVASRPQICAHISTKATSRAGRAIDGPGVPARLADSKGEFMLGNRRYCYPLTVTDFASRYLLTCEALSTTQEKFAFTVFERTFKELNWRAAAPSPHHRCAAVSKSPEPTTRRTGTAL
jgi:hypothetical protein